jgi:LPXTG-motif cell wall-anchored protein
MGRDCLQERVTCLQGKKTAAAAQTCLVAQSQCMASQSSTQAAIIVGLLLVVGTAGFVLYKRAAT